MRRWGSPRTASGPRRWTGYLTIVVLVGLLGGVAMGAIAAARRTQAAFPVFLASTNPSNLTLVTSNWQTGQPDSAGSSLAGAHLVGRLPLVSHVANAENLNAQPLTAHGNQIENPPAVAALGISTLKQLRQPRWRVHPREPRHGGRRAVARPRPWGPAR